MERTANIPLAAWPVARPADRPRVSARRFAALLIVVPAGAADVDPYVPADSETIMIVNFKQIFNSALLKKLGLNTNQNKTLREMLKSRKEGSGAETNHAADRGGCEP